MSAERESFPVVGEMAAGYFSQSIRPDAHNLRYRNRIGEPGLAAECDGCLGWHVGLPNGRTIETQLRLDAMHTGHQLILIRQKGDITETALVDPTGRVVYARQGTTISEGDPMSYTVSISGHTHSKEHELALHKALAEVLSNPEHGVTYSHFAGSHLSGPVHGDAAKELHAEHESHHHAAAVEAKPEHHAEAQHAAAHTADVIEVGTEDVGFSSEEPGSGGYLIP